jgi:cell division protein FtsN
MECKNMRTRSPLSRLIARLLIAMLTVSVCTTAEMIAAAQQVQLPPPEQILPSSVPMPTTVKPAANQTSLPDAPSTSRLIAAQQPEVVPVGPQQPTPPPTEQAPADTTQTPSDQAQPNQTQPDQAQPQPPATAPAQGTEQPLGTAAAEKGETRGGAASKPAGVAIAPAKQKRSKSFLIKLGAVAAGAAAVGAIYALTRSTSSTPPGTQ